MISEIKIAGRTYSFTTKSSEEENTIKQKVEEINNQIELIEKKYKISDSQDLVAMACISLLNKDNSKKKDLKLENKPLNLIPYEKQINQIKVKILQSLNDIN